MIKIDMLFSVTAMTCPAGMQYDAKLAPCQPTCADPLMEQCKERAPLCEGCRCPDGMLVNGDQCVVKNRCGCLTPDKIYIKVSCLFIHKLQVQIIVLYQYLHALK